MRKFHRPLRFLLPVFCFSFFTPIVSHATPSFTRETGIRLTTATPQAMTGSPSAARLYFIRDFQVLTATSSDGISWVEETGVRLSSSTSPSLNVSSITAFTLLPLTAGGFSGLYSAIDSTGAYHIFVATSSDGLNWANISTVTSPTSLIDPASTTTFVGSPRLLKTSGTNWRAYYVQSISSNTDPTSIRIFTSVSSDEGVTWSSGTQLLTAQVGEIAVSTLTSTRVRLFYTTPLTGETTNTQLLSALSGTSNGDSFSLDTGVRFSTASASGPISFPLVVRSTESFRWRLFYAFTASPSTFTHTFSALTMNPDVQSVLPTQVLRSDPAQTFSIRGEIFSSGQSATLSKTGQSDITGTSVASSNDQNMTAVFNTHNKELGAWNLNVTNADGQSGSLANAVTITFSGGSLTLIDNLLRPLTGARTRIDVTVFADGHVKANLYSLDGRLVKSVIDQDVVSGTTSFFWDGKNSEGHLVASGAYVLYVTGPKLDTNQKIVVIK